MIFLFSFFFFFNDTATTEIYTLSLHDALPISHVVRLLKLVQHRGLGVGPHACGAQLVYGPTFGEDLADRKSTRLNSSHTVISYAVFCLKKKKKETITTQTQSNKKTTERTYTAT